LRRLINGRFVKGAITNGIGFDQLDVTYRNNERIFASQVTYNELLKRGDVQLVAPLENIAGRFLVVVISGVLFQIDTDTNKAIDITPIDANLPLQSYVSQLSHIDNNGGVNGVGGYLVIHNWPNKSILVDHVEARTADENNFEVPPSRMGVTAGRRAFIITGDNLMMASDPFGGASRLAPLTFSETLQTDPPGTYLGQIFTMGSPLDVSKVTAIARMPSYLSASEEFLARTVLVSTKDSKIVIAAASPRATWDSSQFISYAGSGDGIAGPLAVTNVGDVVFYISTSGRIKTIGQDQERETGLSETFMDDSLGQYLCKDEANFHYRPWYRDLDHSRSVVKFNRDRIYATAYPIKAPAITKFGDRVYSPTHRAMAVGSIDPNTRLGPTAAVAWEGFYDWMQPIGITTINGRAYVVSKDEHGKVTYHRENFSKVDDHQTTIYTRGYFNKSLSASKSMTNCELYFRVLNGPIKATLSQLINEKWERVGTCTITSKHHSFSFKDARGRTNAPVIPLRIELDHKGCRFELESIMVDGETHAEASSRK
jgi:hypothetical protein